MICLISGVDEYLQKLEKSTTLYSKQNQNNISKMKYKYFIDIPALECGGAVHNSHDQYSVYIIDHMFHMGAHTRGTHTFITHTALCIVGIAA